MTILKSHDEWLKERSKRIGGSDASAVVGMNPYKNNVELWLEKTGQLVPEDISDKPYVKYGHDAEPLLRELFRIDFPEYEVFYEENNMFLNKKYPWGHFSADGWLKDEKGRKGILEIKTTEILQSMQKEKWNHRIPDNYYIQLLHGLLIMEADFAVQLRAGKFPLDWHKDSSLQYLRSRQVNRNLLPLFERRDKFLLFHPSIIFLVSPSIISFTS